MTPTKRDDALAASEWIKATPHETYEGLKRQFGALKTMLNAMGQQISFYSKKDYSLSEKRLAELQASLESERAMNAKLTEEIEALTSGAGGEWRPISEAPRDGTDLLGYVDGCRTIITWAKVSHLPVYGWIDLTAGEPEDRNLCEPFAWQPLPAAPKDEV